MSNCRVNEVGIGPVRNEKVYHPGVGEIPKSDSPKEAISVTSQGFEF